MYADIGKVHKYIAVCHNFFNQLISSGDDGVRGKNLAVSQGGETFFHRLHGDIACFIADQFRHFDIF